MSKETNIVNRNFESFLRDLNIDPSQVQHFNEEGNTILCITESAVIWIDGSKASVRKDHEESSLEYIVETEDDSVALRAFQEYKRTKDTEKSVFVDDTEFVKEYTMHRCMRTA